MTYREFYNTVISANISEDSVNFAKEALAKLDSRNEKRKTTPTKSQIENASIKAVIFDTVKGSPKMVASVIGEKVGISTQKASALCHQMVESGVMSVEDIKVKGKGALKAYSVVEKAE